MKQFVRLTASEFDHISELKPGEKFTHINLQHNGIPTDIEVGHVYTAIKIIRTGIDNGSQKIDPVLDSQATFPIKLVNVRLSAPVETLDLDQQNSLVGKYAQILNLSRDQILKMNCFIREFEIV